MSIILSFSSSSNHSESMNRLVVAEILSLLFSESVLELVNLYLSNFLTYLGNFELPEGSVSFPLSVFTQLCGYVLLRNVLEVFIFPLRLIKCKFNIHIKLSGQKHTHAPTHPHTQSVQTVGRVQVFALCTSKGDFTL